MFAGISERDREVTYRWVFTLCNYEEGGHTTEVGESQGGEEELCTVTGPHNHITGKVEVLIDVMQCSLSMPRVFLNSYPWHWTLKYRST